MTVIYFLSVCLYYSLETFMPKTIDYPRTSYLSAWEVAEVVDDTGGKCSIEACARKLNRKVSGSFKAILGSAVKFGLLISKREMLTTTNLFRRIKNAYDKSEEKIYHREAFLHPPLFSHICRKFRNRELPVHMLDVMLVREFDVEEINAQGVAKAFVEGARMVDILDERNVIADIDQLSKDAPRRSGLASPEMGLNIFRPEEDNSPGSAAPERPAPVVAPVQISAPSFADDAISSLFGLAPAATPAASIPAAAALVPPAATTPVATAPPVAAPQTSTPATAASVPTPPHGISAAAPVVLPESPAAQSVYEPGAAYTIRISGPGLDTQLSVQDEADLVIVQALLDKVRKHVQRR
ncbi:hypothetical protein EJV47_24695 [Hymenobacter gummosus]|uniref:Uncharacterized protein n=1 Tax=Hymenobacter gummosus TaxID=1776032 RepID=A0A3S0JDF0_9BACT|nr:hypothetical protein [Hymenobacter gummosus]RTQ45687.1 hypothetical protein EJV47_24695 [Hymenobacter gummosus]